MALSHSFMIHPANVKKYFCYRGFCAPRGTIFTGLNRDNRGWLLGFLLYGVWLLHHLPRLHPELQTRTIQVIQPNAVIGVSLCGNKMRECRLQRCLRDVTRWCNPRSVSACLCLHHKEGGRSAMKRKHTPGDLSHTVKVMGYPCDGNKF